MKKKLLNIVGDNEGWAIPNRAKNLAFYLSEYFEITNFFDWGLPKNHNDYDLIHMHHPVLKKKICQIQTKWGMELPGPRTFGAVIKYKIYEHADFIVAKNEDMFEKIRDVYKGPLRCISNGVDISIFKPPVYHIGWVGNDTTGEKQAECKRTHLIDQACNLLNVELKGLAKVEFIKDPSVYPKIFPQEDVAKFYRKLDVFVLSSVDEGSSNVILEALATGLPVITTKVGDWKRLSEFGPNIIFPVEGTAEAIKEGIRHALKDRLERRRIMVDNLTWQKISENYIELYKEIGIL